MRLQACIEAGLASVPVVYAENLTEKQKKEFIIKDNVSGGEWDTEMLAAEWDEGQLIEWGLDVDFSDFTASEEGQTDEDAIPEPPKKPKSQRGEIYQLGRHRLMCGDSTIEDDVSALMGGEKADMVFTDPPYGIDINFNADYSKSGGNGVANRQDYGKIEGDTTTDVAQSAIKLCFEMFKASYPQEKEDVLDQFITQNLMSILPVLAEVNLPKQEDKK